MRACSGPAAYGCALHRPVVNEIYGNCLTTECHNHRPARNVNYVFPSAYAVRGRDGVKTQIGNLRWAAWSKADRIKSNYSGRLSRHTAGHLKPTDLRCAKARRIFFSAASFGAVHIDSRKTPRGGMMDFGPNITPRQKPSAPSPRKPTHIMIIVRG